MLFLKVRLQIVLSIEFTRAPFDRTPVGVGTHMDGRDMPHQFCIPAKTSIAGSPFTHECLLGYLIAANKGKLVQAGEVNRRDNIPLPTDRGIHIALLGGNVRLRLRAKVETWLGQVNVVRTSRALGAFRASSQ